MSIEQIKAEIQGKFESIEGFTGKVMPKIVYLQTKSEIDSVEVNGKVNAVGFMQFARKSPSQAETFESNLPDYVTREFQIVFYYEHSPAHDTFEEVDSFVEKFCESFNTDITLNDTILEHERLNMDSHLIAGMTTTRFVHIVTMSLIVYEAIDY